MDSDHIDGIKLVSDARNILVSKEEWDGANSNKYFYRYKKKMWDGLLSIHIP